MLLCFVVVAQLATWQYAHGALRAAVQSAARQSAVFDAPAGACERAFEATRSQLLGGEIGRGVGAVRCGAEPDVVTVSVDASFESWLPIIAGWDTTVSAVAVREVDPQ